ncbi:MAG: hypothetical protein M1830_001742 [Pleopsidium flavum]|nr:MAG: hypothetical protein M1830_001742 [Pleopsidium flavum]
MASEPGNLYTHIPSEGDISHQTIISYFLGPQAENFRYFRDNITTILDEQRDARLNYCPQDGEFISSKVQASKAFRMSTKKISNAVRKAAQLLGRHSLPFWSPRYAAHMCMDISMPALLGYFMTMLYNPNNVSIEVSPLTTLAEMEAGQQLCRLFGYNTDRNNEELPVAWGHITCGGTVANLESIW